LKTEEVVMTERVVIDCDADPYVPEDMRVQHHERMGRLLWSPDAAKLVYPLRPGEEYISTGEFLKRLSAERPLNANVLDWLLKPANVRHIPEAWVAKYSAFGHGIVFFGTTYFIDPGAFSCVRFLFCEVGHWRWRYLAFENGVRDRFPAAVLRLA
jgi:hypothetical protein